MAGAALVTGKAVDDEFRRVLRARFERHDPRAARYWELVGIMNGAPSPVGQVEDWTFIAEAVKFHLATV